MHMDKLIKLKNTINQFILFSNFNKPKKLGLKLIDSTPISEDWLKNNVAKL